MRRFRLLLVLVPLIAVTVLPGGTPNRIEARQECSPVIGALQQASGACNGVWLNYACYGNPNVSTSPSNALPSPSDQTSVFDLTQIRTQSTGPGVVVMILRESGQQSFKLVSYGSATIRPPRFANSMSMTVSLGTGTLCQDTPSGMVAQHPSGQTGTLTINGVRIRMRSTALITMEGPAPVMAFYSDRDGDWELYAMDTGSGDVRQLTNNSANDIHASYAPDGSALVFQTDRTGSTELFIINADGSGARQLTFDGAFAGHPAWSPDGWHIAYDSTANGWRDIYVIQADGGGRRNLTNDEAEDIWPVWSPDGGQIAFYSNRDGNREIYVMNADGGNRRRLTFDGAEDRYPAWSPDGSRIAFASNRSGNYEIYTMNTNGDDVRQLTFDGATDWGPAWSPDGSRLLFASDRDGENEIFVMNPDGTGLQQLTSNSSRDELPVWLPFGAGADHYMSVANLEGAVEVELVSGGPTVNIPVGQRVRIGMDPNENPVTRIEPPTPAGGLFRSPVASYARDAMLPETNINSID